MDTFGWIQLGLYILIIGLLTKPMGLYLVKVLDPEGVTFLDPLLSPLERLFYRILGVDPKEEQDWKEYAFSMLIFSLISLLFTYTILRLQHILPLNPQKLGPVKPDLAFNTAVSFTTNTNWQSYGGESTMSYLSQMVALVSHNFFSAAVGIAVSAALVRGIARHTAQTIGNFWTDVVRVNLYLLLPISLVFAVFLVSQGMIQNFQPYVTAKVIDPVAPGAAAGCYPIIPGKSGGGQAPVLRDGTQQIVQGPMASQVAIKMLGTNGGGFTNANASHPYENPTPLSNFIQMLSIFLIPAGLTYFLGVMVKDKRHGWIVWGVMAAMFLTGVLVCWQAEAKGNPRLHGLGVAAADGNMEGKEVRFGIFNSALFATVTTDASCGAVNAMHDSFTPLGGLVPLFNIHLGELIFGGVGSGLYGMLLYVILAVFISGLMVGRTPEYLGKKIEAYDIKAAVLAMFAVNLPILAFTAWATVSGWGIAGLNNTGPHGLTEILYAYTSAAGNNGSAFAGLSANTPWYNTTLAIAMMIGRFFMIIPLLALAGNLAGKKLVAVSKGSLPVSNLTFAGTLVATIIIVGALTFFPAVALGPILEHFLMVGSKILY